MIQDNKPYTFTLVRYNIYIYIYIHKTTRMCWYNPLYIKRFFQLVNWKQESVGWVLAGHLLGKPSDVHGLCQHTREVLYFYTPNLQYHLITDDWIKKSYVIWGVWYEHPYHKPYQIADHHCRITWVYNKSLCYSLCYNFNINLVKYFW